MDNAISKLKLEKSAGLDLLVNEFFVYAPSHVRNVMLAIFNKLLS